LGKLCRNTDAMWREEDLQKEEALESLSKGDDVSGLGTSIILLNGNMHSLNLLGTEIWKSCEGKTLDELVSALEADFEVERPVLEQDVRNFVASLKGLGLLYEE
jgi:pyrroloquinoline quinone biosynthesis protein D